MRKILSFFEFDEPFDFVIAVFFAAAFSNMGPYIALPIVLLVHAYNKRMNACF